MDFKGALMINRLPDSFRKPLLLSILLHVIVIVALIVELPSQSYRLPGPVSHQQTIVQATAIDPKAVQNQIKAIKAAQERKHKLEAAKIHRLHQQALAMKKARLREQQRLLKIKAEQVQLKQQEIVRKKALARQRQIEKQALIKKQTLLQQKLMEQQLQKDQQQLSTIKNQQLQGAIDQYKAKIIQAIASQWVVPADAKKEMSSQFLIHVAPGGVVLSVKLTRSSGNETLDRSARVAIFKASPLPVPSNPAIFDKFRELRLTVSPKEVLNE